MSLKLSLSYRKATALIVVAGVALSLPTLGQGFVLDDQLILSVIEEWYPDNTNAFDIYSTLAEQLQLPWWTSTEARISFFRVLSSALLRLDHLLFQRWAVGYHLHSLLWLGVLLVLVSRLYRRLVPRLAPFALLLFAVDDCHGFTAGWISNRHAMIAVTFGLAGLLAHLRWREDGWRPGLLLSVLGYVAALSSGETALTVLAYAGAYELLAGPGVGLRRWIGLLPPTLVVAAYVIWYKYMGYGFQGAGFYIDPGSQPLEFLQAAVVRIPALLGNALTGLPPDMWGEPSMRPVLVTTGSLAILGLAAVLRFGWTSFDETERRHLRWLAAGALLSSVPTVAASPSSRQLLAAMLSIAVLLAAFLHVLRTRWWPSVSRMRWGTAALILVFFLVHFGAAPLQRIAFPRVLANQHQNLLSTLSQIPEWCSDPERGEVIALNAPDVLTLLYGPVLLDYLHDTHCGRWHVLTFAPYDHQVKRTTPDTLEMKIAGAGEMLTSPAETVWPPEGDFTPGRLLDRGFLQAEILEIGKTGPTHIDFHFAAPLNDPDLVTLKWGERGFEAVRIPPVGESLFLQHIPLTEE